MSRSTRSTLTVLAALVLVFAGLLPVQPVAAAVVPTSDALPWLWQPAQYAANPLYSDLNQVSCLPTSFCAAIGSSSNSQGGDKAAPIAERARQASAPAPVVSQVLVDGTWHEVRVPLPRGAYGAAFDALTCWDSSFCVAVGAYWGDGVYRGLIETYDGSAWQATPAPLPPAPARPSSLRTVSCDNPGTECVAYADGYSGDRPTMFQYRRTLDGSGNPQWTVTDLLPMLPAEAFTALGSPACTAMLECVFPITVYPVGDGVQQLYGYRWSPTTGGRVEPITPPSNLPAGTVNIRSQGGCDAVSTCLFGGYVQDDSQPSGGLTAIALQYDNAAWTFTVLPATGLPAGATTQAGTAWANLVDVSCPAPRACFLLGAASDAGQLIPLLYTLAAGQWTTAVVPGADGYHNTRLACATADYCVIQTGNAKESDLVEQYISGSFVESVIDAPNSAAYDLVCTSVRWCVAVGAYDSGRQALIASPMAFVAPYQPYVALGDSYSSGEGLAPFDTPTNTLTNHCHRSRTKGYADQVATAVDIPISFHACSGAVPADYWRPNPTTSKPLEFAQRTYLNASTRLVTMSFGGNDLNWVDTLLGCLRFEVQGTGRVLWTDPAGCRRLLADAPALVAQLDTNIRAVLADVVRRAPNAQIRVLTYPAMFPDRGATTSGCRVGKFVLPPNPISSRVQFMLPAATVKTFVQVEQDADQAIASAVADYRRLPGVGSRLAVVDLPQAFGDWGARSHAVDCGDSSRPKQWINAVRVSTSALLSLLTHLDSFVPTLKNAATASFHPTEEGARHMAQAVVDSLPCSLVC